MHALAAPEKVTALAARFTTAGFPHAFGGSVALCAYLRARPIERIDFHVFLAPRDAEPLLARLVVLGLEIDRSVVLEQLAIRGRAELVWGSTPLSIALGLEGLHELARPRVRRVPFGDRWLYVLSAEDLMLAHTLAGSPGGDAELEELVLTLGSDLDIAYVRRSLSQLGVGPESPDLERILAPRLA